MDTQSIFDQGGMFIPNPKYNPKSKKNTEPAYIHTTNVGEYGSNPIADSFKNNLDRTWVMGDTTSYQRYGVTPNKVNDMDTERADHQSALAKFGNALAQTVVSEVGLGTALGFADLADFVGSRILHVMDKDYQNPLSNYLEGLQDKFNNEVAPIYATPGVDISNGGLFNAGWWASNIPSIASSLTLLLPAAATTKGLSLLAKLGTKSANIASGTRATIKALSKALPNKSIGRWMNKRSVIERGNMFVENGITAALSRTMENYQEGRQVYNDMYAEASEKLRNMSDEDYANFVNNNPETLKDVDASNRDEVAKKIAKESADTDFYGNYVNTVSDIIELYALRNAFGSGRLADIGRTSVRKAQRLSMRYPGKTAAEIEVLEKARPVGEKIKDTVGDALFGSKLAVFAQLNEGTEEAVNYVMQEEGMHTGRTILGTDMQTSFWDNRLKSYMRSPQLWESAFWGVLGGVVFQAGGSYLKRVQQTMDDKRKAKKKTNEETGEETPDVGWRGLSELPEVQRRVKDIESRAQRAQDVADKLKLIEQGKNPFNPEIELTDEVEKEAAKRLVRKQAVVDATMNAINNGNFDLTREYFENDDVRKAMVEKGVVSEEKSKEWQQEVLNDMDKVKEHYEEEVEHLDNLSSAYDGKIPMEFIQIAATDNVYNRLNVETLTEQQEDYKAQYNKAKETAQKAGKISGNLDYERNIELEMQVNTLYALYKERRELEKKQKEKLTLTGQIALDEINKNIKTQQGKLYTETANKNLSDTLFALGNIYSENKSHGEIDSDIESLIDEAINKGTFRGFEKFLGLEENSVDNITDAEDLEKFKKEYLDRSKAYKEAMKEINSLGEDVPNLYRSAIQTQFLIDKSNNAIVATQDEFNRYMTNANNTLSEMRRNAINQAYDDIYDVAKEVGVDNIKDFVQSAVATGKADNSLIKDLSDANKTKLSNAIKVINFGNIHNKPLYGSIAALLDTIKYNDNEEKSNISNSSETTQNPSSNNQSQETNPINTEPENTQPSNLSQQESQPQNHKMALKDVGDGKYSLNVDDENGDVNLLLSDPDVSSYTMDIANSPYATNPAVLGNKNLFNIDSDASIIDNNAKIIENPVVVLGDNNTIKHLEKGRVGKINDDTVEPEPSNTAKLEPEPSTTLPVENAANAKLEKAGIKSNPDDTNNATPETQTPVEPTNPTPSTGAVEQNSSSNAQPTTSVNPDDKAPVYNNQDAGEDGMTKADEIERNVKLVMGEHINVATYSEANAEAARNAAKDWAIKNNINVDDIIESILNELKSLNMMLKEMGIDVNDTQNARYLEPIINKPLDYAFDKVFADFVDQYTKANFIPKFNGKYRIYISDILRICTERYANREEMAKSFCEQVKQYLLSDDGKKKYEIIDEDEINSAVAIANASRNSEQIARGEDNVYSTRVDIIDIANQDRSLEQDEIYREAMASVNEGDDVDLVVNEADEGRVYINYTIKAGTNTGTTVTLGYMAVPSLVGNSYNMLNEYWAYDVDSQGNGKIFNAFRDIFTTQGQDYDLLRNVLIEAFKYRNTNIPNNLIKDFAENPIIQNLINSKVIRPDKKHTQYSLERALKHISKIYNYDSRLTTTMNPNTKANLIDNVLSDYASKLYNSYDAIAQIKTSTTTKVSYVNEGQINRAVTDDSLANYGKMPYVGEGVKDLQSAKLGIIAPNNSDVVTISSKEDENTRGWEAGSTVIAVYSRNKRPDFVKAIGIQSAESPIIKSIVTVVRKELGNIIRKIHNDIITDNETNDTFDELKDLINSLFASSYGATYNSLLRGFGDYKLSISDNTHNSKNEVRGIDVSIYHEENGKYVTYGALTILYKGEYGKSLAIKTSKDAGTLWFIQNKDKKLEISATGRDNVETFVKKAQEELDNIVSKCGFNVSALGIQTDNKPNILANGFFKRENGKLTVPILNKQYNSYNDFVVYNNLVRVNTEINEFNSNFVTRGDNQRANQQMFVDLPIVKQNTVISDNNTNSLNNSNVNKNGVDVTEYNRIKTQLSGKVNTGEDVIRAIFGDEKVDKLKEQTKDVYNDLFPERVIVDEAINNYNGKTRDTVALHTNNGPYSLANNHTSHSTIADSVVVGSVFLNAAASTNSNTKSFAISKLVHEQIHSRLMNMPNKNEFLRELEDIYNEFRAVFNPRRDELVTKYNNKTLTKEEEDEYKIYKHINGLFTGLKHNKGNTQLYEEFLAESLTNAHLFNYLNNVSVDGDFNTDKKTIWDKIVDFISKLFGYKVNDNSLLKKELKVINDFINNNGNNNSNNSSTTETTVVENPNTNTEKETKIDNTGGWDADILPETNGDTDGWDADVFEQEARELEPIINNSNVIVTTSHDKFITSLPTSIQQNVKDLINDGYINMTCSI